MGTTVRRLASTCVAEPLLLFAALPLAGPAQFLPRGPHGIG